MNFNEQQKRKQIHMKLVIHSFRGQEPIPKNWVCDGGSKVSLD